jgi:transcriptional regulator with XRE-family HTH domain
MRTPNRTTQPEEGAALRKWREAVGIKQSVFAKRAGLSQNLVSLLEAGKRNFTQDSSGKIYKAQAELNAEHAERLTAIALNRDSRIVALQDRATPPHEVRRIALALANEIIAMRERTKQPKDQREIGAILAEAQGLWMERNLKPVTEELSELRRQVADLQRLVGLKTEALASEAQAQDLQEQIEQRVRKGK